MNRKFDPTSAPIRSLAAVFALATTLLIAGSIEGLVQHYEVAQASHVPATAVAAR